MIMIKKYQSNVSILKIDLTLIDKKIQLHTKKKTKTVCRFLNYDIIFEKFQLHQGIYSC